MQPISPHQTHSLGLSVNTNTQTYRLNEGATQTRTSQINKIEGKTQEHLKRGGGGGQLGVNKGRIEHHLVERLRSPWNVSVLLGDRTIKQN